MPPGELETGLLVLVIALAIESWLVINVLQHLHCTAVVTKLKLRHL